MALECVIFVGLPGAGKSSLYREKFAATHEKISKDLWPKASGREDRQRELIVTALTSGRSVVIDNTNPRVDDRAPLIRIAREHGAVVIGYFFNVNTRTAVARNAERTGRDKVPNVAIFTTAKRLERPTLAEGFDLLYQAEIGPDRALQITELLV